MHVYIELLQSVTGPKCVCTKKSPKYTTSRLWEIHVCTCIYVYIYIKYMHLYMYVYTGLLQSVMEPKRVCTKKSPRCTTSRLWNICTYLNIHIYIYIYIYLYVCIYRAAAIRYRAKVCLHEKSPRCTTSQVWKYIYTSIYIYMCKCVHICTYIYMYVYIYMASAILCRAKVCVHRKVAEVYHFSALEYICMRLCMYIYIYICMCVCMYIYIIIWNIYMYIIHK